MEETTSQVVHSGSMVATSGLKKRRPHSVKTQWTLTFIEDFVSLNTCPILNARTTRDDARRKLHCFKKIWSSKLKMFAVGGRETGTDKALTIPS